MILQISSVAPAISAIVCLTVGFLVWHGKKPGYSRAVIIVALGAAAVHLLASSPGALAPPALWLVTALRNLAWLAVIRTLFALDGRHASVRPVRPVILALTLVAAMQLPLVFLADMFLEPAAFDMVARVSDVFNLLFVTGTLVLIHNLYAGAGPRQQPRIAWITGAMVLAWGYELNIFAIAYLVGHVPDLMLLGRAVVWAAAALLVWVDGRQKGARRISPSRSVSFQSLSLIVIALYLFALFAVDGVLSRGDAGAGTLSRFGSVVLAVSVGALLASGALRAWLREIVVRNFFRHRYDYRQEWLRLSNTMAAVDHDEQSLEQRAVQAMADIVDSPAGILLSPDDENRLTLSARWNWSTLEVPATAITPDQRAAIESDPSVRDLDGARAALVDLPIWLTGEERAWALVPLQVAGRLAGVIVLARPPYSRRLDWEDLDLLRIVGHQIAALLGENEAQKALLEAARFDEFNRRIAFVMHDIKNLASQLGLLVSNAERHIEKPAFRADMLITLRSATGRLENLLGRLSNYGGQGVSETRIIVPRDAVMQALQIEIDAGLVLVHPGGETALRGDADAVEQVLRHLTRNAIEASEQGSPVEVRFAATDRLAGIEVVDHGCGMSPEFIAANLFKPFVSTKTDGFGIGAFEARELVRAMGGRLEVESRVGEGSRFIVWLPRAEAPQRPAIERKVA